MHKNNNTIKYICLIALYFIGIGAGLSVWNKIVLPFHNPWNVVSPFSILQYNPTNTTVRFVVLILLPSVRLLGAYFLNLYFIKQNRFDSFFSNASLPLPDFSTGA